MIKITANLLLPVLFILISIVGNAQAQEFVAYDLDANVVDLRPTQDVIGRAYAEKKRKKMRRKWAEAKVDRPNLTYENFLQERLDQRRLPALIGPNGKYYILDGHHRIWSTAEEINEYSPGYWKEARSKLRIVGDYSHLSDREFVEEVLIHGKEGRGYFSKKTLKKLGKKPEKLLVQFDSFSKLKNHPMRSIVGFAFKKVGWSATPMRTFIQFILGEYIEDLKDFDLPAKNRYAKKNIDYTIDYILSSKKAMTMIRDSTPPENRMEVFMMLEDSIKKRYQELRKSNPKLAKKIKRTSDKKFRELADEVRKEVAASNACSI